MAHAVLRLAFLAALAVSFSLALGARALPERADAQTSRHQVSVTAVGADGGAVEGLQVSATVDGEGPGESESGLTATGGALRLWLVAGVYHLTVLTDRHTDCTVFGPDNPGSDWPAVLALDGGGSSQVRLVLVGDEPFGYFIPLSCHFDVPYYPIQGTILGPADEPIEGLSVYALRLGDYDATIGGTTSSRDGSFEIEAPGGSYLLRFWAAVDGERCELGHAGRDGKHRFGNLAYAARDGQHIVIDEQAATGIAVRLPGSPSELCRAIEGRVSSLDGDPLPDVWVGASGRGSLLARRASGVTGSDGAFNFRGPDGSYSLRIRAEVGTVCTITGTPDPERRPHGGIVVAGDVVTHIGLVISGDQGPPGKFVDCLYPAEFVTTELTPGWNLGGWTGPETSVRAVFEATPRLTAVYSWDSATQSFRAATRGTSGIHGPLEMLTPGMGLWLLIGGTGQVNWSRPFLMESALSSLTEGWNLVSWGGRDGASSEDIFNSLGAEAALVAMWDRTTQRFVLIA